MADARRTTAPSLTIGLTMAAAMLLVAILAPIFLTGAATNLTSALRQPPSPVHWFGTDQFGHDILARTLVATRLTLIMATSATVLSVVFGVLLGGVAWLLPRRLRDGILRVIDSTVAFPALVLGLVIAAILGPGAGSAVVAIGVAGIPAFARLTSNLTSSVILRDYVVTSRLLGVPGWSLFTRHVLPNIAGPLLMIATSSFALTLLDISSLSFIGLGVQSPQFDYGLVLNESLSSIYVQPWGTVPPAFMLTYAGVMIMLIGDGVAATRARRPQRRVATPVSAVTSAPVRPDVMLQIGDLTVTAPSGQPIVHGISFDIHPGEVLGLVGESGSGKSMTAMAIAGLLADGLHAQASAMRLDDLDLRGSVPAKRLAEDIGIVFQDPGTTYNPALRMGSQLTEVARVHLGMSRSRARTRMAEALSSIRISSPEHRLRQHAFELSGGMLQRATIASVMVTNPKLIIADEPTTALDVTVQVEVLRQFRAVNRAEGTAMLFISHDIGVVQELCDRILVMKDGRIVEEVTGPQLRTADVAVDYTKQLLAAALTLAPRHTPADIAEVDV